MANQLVGGFRARLLVCRHFSCGWGDVCVIFIKFDGIHLHFLQSTLVVGGPEVQVQTEIGMEMEMETESESGN